MTTPKIENKDAVLDWFETNGCSKFTLYRGHSNDAKNRIFSQSEDHWSVEQAKAKLDTLLGWYGNKGDFYLFVTDSKNGTGGGHTTLISLYGTGGNYQNGTQMNGIQGLPQGYVSLEQVGQIVENAMLKMQVKQLEEQINGLGNARRDMSAFEGLMEQVLQDEGSGKEIAIGFRDMLRGFGMAGANIASKLGDKSDKKEQKQSPKQQAKKSQNTEGGVELNDEDKDGRKFSYLFPVVKSEFQDFSPQNVFAGIWKFYENADDGMKQMLKMQLLPYIQEEQEKPFGSEQE